MLCTVCLEYISQRTIWLPRVEIMKTERLRTWSCTTCLGYLQRKLNVMENFCASFVKESNHITGCITRFVKRGWGTQFQGAYLKDGDFRFEAAAPSPEVRLTLCSKEVEIIIKRALRSISQIGPYVYTNPAGGVWVSAAFSYPACNAHAPYCHLWPALLYNIFPHDFIDGTIIKKSYRTKNVCLIFTTTSV